MDNQNEIWKPIDGFPDYEVSDLGRVRSLKHCKIRILKQGISSRGYHNIVICQYGLTCTKNVHRLVAAAFLGVSELQIDHINGNKLDNRIDNLRYCTDRENKSYYITKQVVSSKYIGVCFDKQHNKWRGYINVNGRRVHLGLFVAELEASQAYQDALAIHNAGGKVLSAKERKKAAKQTQKLF